MIGSFKWHHRLVGVIVLAASLSVVYSSQAHAYQNAGFLSGVTTCTTDQFWNYHCPDAFASATFNNVIPGTPAVPAWAYAGTTQAEVKTNYYNWLVNTYNDTSSSWAQQGATVIAMTMLGYSNHTVDFAALKARLDNPAITVAYLVDDPNNYGAISFSGRRVDGMDRDVFFTYDHDSMPKELLVFYNNGVPVYVVEVPCANPVGEMAGLPVVTPPKSWSLSGSTTVSTPTAQPGQSVTFTHYVTNNGPDQADGVWYDTLVSAGTPGSPKSGTGPYSIAPGTSLNGGTDTIVIPANAPAGTQYCEVVGYAPSNSSGGGYANGAWTCVTVVYDYELTPVVTTSSSMVPVGGSVTADFLVTKTGTVSNPTQVTIRELIIPPNGSLPIGMGQHDDITCASYGVTCNDIETVSTNMIFTVPTTPIGTRTINAGAYAAGTQICRVLVVVSRDETAGRSRDSEVKCVIVAASPYIAGVAGDMSAGGSLKPACTGSAGFTGSATAGLGSFGEYGVVATGDVVSFGSGGFITGNQLTFANFPAATLGNYKPTHCITDFEAQYAAKAASGSNWGGGNLPGSGGVYTTASAAITINAAAIPAGRQYVIYAPGATVTITGNITYQTTGFASFGSAPQLVVIANRINVNSTVTEVAGMFYSRTVFHSCSEAGDNPNANKPAISAGGSCRFPLRVNGAVIALDRAITPRTSGGIVATPSPAEVFVMRPEVYLTDVARNDSQANIVTDLVREAAPRY